MRSFSLFEKLGRLRATARQISRAGRCIVRSNAFGALIALGAATCVALGPAYAEPTAKASVIEGDLGHGRLLLHFTELKESPNYSVEQFNGIFVVTFEEPINVELSQLVRKLGRYVSVLRMSDDKKTIRFGLSRGVSANLSPAAEKLFIDFLPDSWTGEPPLLPQDVIVDLAQRTERQLKEQRLEQARLRDDFINPNIEVSVGESPTFTRIEMNWNIEFRSRIVKSENEVSIEFDVSDQPDVASINADLPELLKNIIAESNDEQTRLTFQLKDGAEVRTYREGNTMVLDLTSEELRAQSGIEYLNGLTAQKPILSMEGRSNDQEANLNVPLTLEELAPELKDQSAEIQKTDQGDVIAAPVPNKLLPNRPEASEGLEQSANNDDSSSSFVVAVSTSRTAAATEMLFPFRENVPAAIFQRGKTLWAIFDYTREFDLRSIGNVFGDDLISQSVFKLSGEATAIRLVFSKTGVVGVSRQGPSWVLSYGDTISTTSQPIAFERGLDDRGRSVMRAKFEQPSKAHRFIDPGVGDEVIVVTGHSPVRGIVREQRFVEFMALASTQGLAFVPFADDVNITLGENDVLVSRGGLGLRLSKGATASAILPASPGGDGLATLGSFNSQVFNNAKLLHNRIKDLQDSVALADRVSVKDKRKNLIRFLLANEREAEALGQLELMRQNNEGAESDPDWVILHAAAITLLGRYDEALDKLENAVIAGTSEAAFWRSIAASGNNKWALAAENAVKGARALSSYPNHVQKLFYFATAEAAINTNRHAAAAESLAVIAGSNSNEADKAKYFTLRALLADAAGRRGDAITALEYVLRTNYPPSVARARFELARLDLRDNAVAADELIERLEELAASWRGDGLELKVRRDLGRLYVQKNEPRLAFESLGAAQALDDQHDITRAMYNEMQDVFSGLFRDKSEQAMSSIEAVGLFYDFRPLLPPGRRGDELVRKLAARLVKLDLLDKAAEILMHQVDHRLTGSGKAQIAADAAAIYMLNEEPNKALNLLRRTRQSRLPRKVIRQRRILEAVALGQVGRAGLGLELIQDFVGPDVDEVRADMFWYSADFEKAALAYEASLGNRWATSDALSDGERMRVLRAAIAHSYAQNELGLNELRRKFSQLMSQSPDAVSFDVLTEPLSRQGVEFDAVVDALRGVRAIQGFMKSYTQRYLESPMVLDTPEQSAAVQADESEEAAVNEQQAQLDEPAADNTNGQNT